MNTQGSLSIEIRLPANRALPGWLRVLDASGNTVFACACLGKADNAEAIARRNASRDPLKPFGDTPLGSWIGTIGPKMADTRTYGVNPVIMLRATGGDALQAAKNGRAGIWIHGGSLRMGNLRPTFGCVRVADPMMAAILEILLAAKLTAIPVDTVAA